MKWSQREKDEMSHLKSQSYNTGEQEYDMQAQTQFSTEPTKEDWSSSVHRVRLLAWTPRAR